MDPKAIARRYLWSGWCAIEATATLTHVVEAATLRDRSRAPWLLFAQVFPRRPRGLSRARCDQDRRGCLSRGKGCGYKQHSGGRVAGRVPAAAQPGDHDPYIDIVLHPPCTCLHHLTLPYITLLSHQATKIFRIVRVMRVLRVFRLMKLNRLFALMEEQLKLNPSLVRLVKNFFMLSSSCGTGSAAYGSSSPTSSEMTTRSSSRRISGFHPRTSGRRARCTSGSTRCTGRWPLHSASAWTSTRTRYGVSKCE